MVLPVRLSRSSIWVSKDVIHPRWPSSGQLDGRVRNRRPGSGRRFNVHSIATAAETDDNNGAERISNQADV
jgi:hypothetical protein